MDFLSIVNFHAGNLCAFLWSTFSRSRRGFRTWDHFHRTEGTCKGGQSHRIFFLSLIFMLEIYVQLCGQRFLEAGEVSGLGTNSIESRGYVRVANHKGFFSIPYFHLGNLCPILVSTVSRNKRGFMSWDQFHPAEGTSEGGQS